VCTDCRRCSVSCPVGIDVARVMEGLRLLAQETGQAPAESPIVRFHRTFMDEIRRRGRLHELSLLWRLRSRTGRRRDRLALATMLLGKGKVSFRAGRPKEWSGLGVFP